jgi:hypothetical protein
MIEQILPIIGGEKVYITVYDRLTIDDVYQHFVKKGIYDVMKGNEIETATTKTVRDDFMQELR